MMPEIRVLYVDDEPDFADVAARFLERVDDRMEVHTETSPRAAMGLLAETEFDCIVSDYDMPETDGIEFLEEVRDIRPDLPFILHTGMGSEEIASEAISKGVTDYLQKGNGKSQYTILANRIVNTVERHRAQRTADAHEDQLERFNQAVETAGHAIYITDANGRIEYVNPAFESLTGYDEDDAIGQTPELLDSGEMSDDYFEDLWTTVHAGDRWREEIVNRRKSGELYTALQTIDPITDDEGRPTAYVAIQEDISGRKERERELLEALDTYRGLFEGIGDAVFIHETGGQFLAVNDAACERLGYTENELLEMSPSEIDAEDSVITDRMDRLAEADTSRFEADLEANDGGRIPVEITTSTVEYFGKPAVLSVARDISERKARERQLERFAGIVSHDLRNPLTVAQTRLELAARDRKSEDLAEARDALDRMERMISDLLTLSRDRNAAGGRESVQLSELVRGCWATLETGSADLVVDTDRTIRANPGRLKRLFENLYRNAIEHGGDVTVTVRDCDGGVFVEDDGPGIPPDEREAVFEAGYSTAAEGTGLGLSIVEQIVDAHDWEVHVAEGADGGARFEITGMGDATE